jgi:MFS superfamily sulfate permease-like transporter
MCSLFSGFPACSGLTRSLIVEGVGARTQVYSLISSLVVLTAFLGIGFLFKELPNAVLAAIIFVSLIKKCFESREIVKIFKKSKFEGLAWCATFLGVIVLDIDYGIYIGLACALFLNIIQSQRPNATILGVIKNTDIFEDVRLGSDILEYEGIKIIRYEANIYYANVDNFLYKIGKLSSINPKEAIASIEKKKEKLDRLMLILAKQKNKNLSNKKIFTEQFTKEVFEKEMNQKEEQLKKDHELEINNLLDRIQVKHLILDMSCVNYIDSMGVDSILQLRKMFEKLKVQLHLAHVKRKAFFFYFNFVFSSKFK